MKATNPNDKAIRLYEACKESLALKAPLSKRISIIGSASMVKPITAGTPIRRINLIDQSSVFENANLFSVTNNEDRRGKITVPIAIAKIPKGSCINLSETYNQLGLPVGNKEANMVSISMLI